MKNNSIVITFCLVIVLLLQGCTRFAKIIDKKYEPTDPNKIELFFSKLPDRDYEEIAIVNTATGVTDLNVIKRSAAKLGANAVIQIRFDQHVNGIAIRWK